MESATKLIRVGELAKASGKTVRALHLYEELGLLEPAARSEGGFRLYGPDAVARIEWIGKLQSIGFSLPEIQGFVKTFRDAGSGREATGHVRAVFRDRLASTRAQISELQAVERDLLDAIEYLDSCDRCSTHAPTECGTCGHHGHAVGAAPPLFAGLSGAATLPGTALPTPVSLTALATGGATSASTPNPGAATNPGAGNVFSADASRHTSPDVPLRSLFRERGTSS